MVSKCVMVFPLIVKLFSDFALNAVGVFVGQLALKPRCWASTAVTHGELALDVTVVVPVTGGVVAERTTHALKVGYANDARDACYAGFNFCYV